MNYVLKPGVAFGNIDFLMNQEEVIAKLGKPDEIREEETSDMEGPIRIVDFEYEDLDLLISFTYFDDEYDSLNIFSGKVIFNNVDLYSMDKEEILDTLTTVSEVSIKEARVVDLDPDDDEEYDFPDIGMTIWFDSDGDLNDVSVGLGDDEFFEEEDEQTKVMNFKEKMRSPKSIHLDDDDDLLEEFDDLDDLDEEYDGEKDEITKV
jgi:hypothetical protein